MKELSWSVHPPTLPDRAVCLVPTRTHTLKSPGSETTYHHTKAWSPIVIPSAYSFLVFPIPVQFSQIRAATLVPLIPLDTVTAAVTRLGTPALFEDQSGFAYC